MRKAQKYKKSRSSRAIAAVVMAFSLVVLAMMTGTTAYTIIMQNARGAITTAETIESALLANGLAIIGIVVAVWAGLNIVQAVERGKYEALSKEVEKYREEVKQYREERRQINRNAFINQLERSNEILTKYLGRVLKKEIPEIAEVSASIYAKLCDIEQKFSSMYFAHYQQKTAVKREDKDVLLNELDDVEREVDTKSGGIRLYLIVRKAEVYFYSAYFAESVEHKMEMDKAIRNYYRAFPRLRECIRGRAGISAIMSCGIEGFVCIAYMLNMIGEANNKMYELCKGGEDDTDEYEKEAENAFKALESLLKLDMSVAREVYYRNYGTFLEHRYRKLKRAGFSEKEELSNRIQNLYEKAIETVMVDKKEKPKQQTFYVYLQFMHRKYTEESESTIESMSPETRNLLKVERQKVLNVAMTAIDLFPTYSVFLKHKAFALYELYTLSDQGMKSIYKRMFLECVEMLQCVWPAAERKDDYTSQLLKQKIMICGETLSG